MQKVERIGTNLAALGLAKGGSIQCHPNKAQGKFVILNRPDTFRIKIISSTLIAVAASCGAVGSVLALADSVTVTFAQLKEAAKWYCLLVGGFALCLRSYAGRVTVDAVNGHVTLRGHRFMGTLRKQVEVHALRDMSVVKDFSRFILLRFPGPFESVPLHRFWMVPKAQAFSEKKGMFMQPDPIPISADFAAKLTKSPRTRGVISDSLEKISLSHEGSAATAADEARILAFLKHPFKN